MIIRFFTWFSYAIYTGQGKRIHTYEIRSSYGGLRQSHLSLSLKRIHTYEIRRSYGLRQSHLSLFQILGKACRGHGLIHSQRPATTDAWNRRVLRMEVVRGMGLKWFVSATSTVINPIMNNNNPSINVRLAHLQWSTHLCALQIQCVFVICTSESSEPFPFETRKQ